MQSLCLNMLGSLSLSKLGLVSGIILTLFGFVTYFTNQPILNLMGFSFGFPLLLGGLALKASELEPVPFSTPTLPEVLTLREQEATITQNQVRKDVTRYRYGQVAHLDRALKLVGLSPTNEECPILKGIRETSIDGHYAFVLEFESGFISLETWLSKQEKLEKYFGPGIRVELTQPAEQKIEMTMITTSQAS